MAIKSKDTSRPRADAPAVPCPPDAAGLRHGLQVHRHEVQRHAYELETQNRALRGQADADRHATRQVVAAHEAERERLARALHDDLGQRLSALKMDLAALAQRDVRDADIAAMVATLDDAVASVRRLANDLCPLMLDDLGLAVAVEALARQSARQYGLKLKLQLTAADPPSGDPAALTLYRLLQASLPLLAGQRGHGSLRIELRDEPGARRLTLQGRRRPATPDDAAASGTSRWTALCETARLLGCTLAVAPVRRDGERVCVRMPLRAAESAAESSPRVSSGISSGISSSSASSSLSSSEAENAAESAADGRGNRGGLALTRQHRATAAGPTLSAVNSGQACEVQSRHRQTRHDAARRRTMLKLLIAVDGSAHAQRAIEAAARLQPQTVGLDIVLVNVRDLPIHADQYPPLDAQAVEFAAQQHQSAVLETALASARQAGLKQARTQAEVGLAAQQIARTATDLGVDMILIGTHGRSALGGLLLGSVAQRVVHLAAVPVLLVK